MLDFFEIDFSYLEENYSLLDTFFLGLTYSFSMALPFSPPLLICLRQMVIQGVWIGLIAYLGTAFGYTFFFSLLFFGARNIVQFWYDWEPVFFIIGIALSCKTLFGFYTENTSNFSEYELEKSNKISSLTPSKILSVGGLSFVLVLCNPINIVSTSRLILNPDISKLESPAFFLISFFIGFFIFSSAFGFLFHFLRNYLVNYKNWQNTVSPNEKDQETDVVKQSLTFNTFLLRFINPFNQSIVIASLSLILISTTKWSWQIFLQYPAENLFTGFQFISKSLPIDFSQFDGVRTFPDCDTNIKNRERPGYVFRHFPIDSLVQHRLWEEKYPLTEKQVVDIYHRYRTHRINKLSDDVDRLKFIGRTPFADCSTPEQIKHLKEVKRNYDIMQEHKFSSNVTQNKAKGFPNLSYAQEKGTLINSSDNLYLHPSIKDNWPASKIANLEATAQNRNILDFLY
jgi:threonine/homoserine/homoserine lactone efflux protein